MSMSKIPYDSALPDMRLLRLAAFERLRREPNWHHLPSSAADFDQYVEHVNPERKHGLVFHLHEVLWQLLTEGVLAPGSDSSNLNLPFFHVTEFGRAVLDSTGPNAFDPEGYLDFVRGRVAGADATVLAYLAESLHSLRRGTLVASAVMLGIAAERVFLLLSDSLHAALSSAKEKKDFSALLERFPMKPKLDWVRAKIEALQATRTAGFPENAGIMVVAMYDLIRQQRNELGHPRENPPLLTRNDVFGNLQVFVRYYETAEMVRSFLASNRV
jgi:hypothetical protein